MQPMRATVIKSLVEDFIVREVSYTHDFLGVRVPLKAQQLDKKPEGQRAWKWEVLYSTPDFLLTPNDVLVFNCLRYRVDAKLDYSEYGYLEYHIVQDYSN
jgi:hypothetical protein